jgi:hypothetical protein
MAKAPSRPATLDQLLEQFRKSLRPAQRRELDRLIAARDAEIVRCAVAAAVQSEEMVHAFVQKMMQSTKEMAQLDRSTLAEIAHLRRELHRQPQYRRRILAARNAEIVKLASEGKQAKEITQIVRHYWPGTSDAAVRQIISRAKRL